MSLCKVFLDPNALSVRLFSSKPLLCVLTALVVNVVLNLVLIIPTSIKLTVCYGVDSQGSTAHVPNHHRVFIAFEPDELFFPVKTKVSEHSIEGTTQCSPASLCLKRDEKQLNFVQVATSVHWNEKIQIVHAKFHHN